MPEALCAVMFGWKFCPYLSKDDNTWYQQKNRHYCLKEVRKRKTWTEKKSDTMFDTSTESEEI